MSEHGSSGERRDAKIIPSREDGEPFRLLFVCTGNTCRSPMAAALTSRALEARGWSPFEVRSAGVAARAGARASDGSLRVAAEDGLDLGAHRSTLLTPELVEWADLVLAMSPGHIRSVETMGGSGKVDMITRFANAADEASSETDSGSGVSDPIGGDDRRYRETYEELRDLVDRVLGRLSPIVSP